MTVLIIFIGLLAFIGLVRVINLIYTAVHYKETLRYVYHETKDKEREKRSKES